MKPSVSLLVIVCAVLTADESEFSSYLYGSTCQACCLGLPLSTEEVNISALYNMEEGAVGELQLEFSLPVRLVILHS